MDASSRHHPQQLPSPPSPSPSWADVVRGGHSREGQERRGEPGRGHLPPANSRSIPAHSIPLSLPSAHAQFRAWLSCRKAGLPARLVLETDGTTEEISFWFRPSTNGIGLAPREAVPNQQPVRRRGKRRRRRRAERSKGSPATMAAASASDSEVTGPNAGTLRSPLPVSVDSSPPAGSPPAKRPRTRAAARRCGQQDPPTPEKSRAAAEANQCMLDLDPNISMENIPDRTEPPDSPPPSSPLPPDRSADVSAADGNSLDKTMEDTGTSTPSTKVVEPDYREELWEDGRCLNTRRPPWNCVFYPRGPKYCRFCQGEPMPNDDENDEDFVCKDCNELSTFQLVVKHAPRWHYYKQN